MDGRQAPIEGRIDLWGNDLAANLPARATDLTAPDEGTIGRSKKLECYLDSMFGW